jgi:hypothetical protein
MSEVFHLALIKLTRIESIFFFWPTGLALKLLDSFLGLNTICGTQPALNQIKRNVKKICVTRLPLVYNLEVYSKFEYAILKANQAHTLRSSKGQFQTAYSKLRQN